MALRFWGGEIYSKAPLSVSRLCCVSAENQFPSAHCLWLLAIWPPLLFFFPPELRTMIQFEAHRPLAWTSLACNALINIHSPFWGARQKRLGACRAREIKISLGVN